MSTTYSKSTRSGASSSTTLDDEITKAVEKLKRLQEKKRDIEAKQRERNQRSVGEFIKIEKLDLISIFQWRQALPEIRGALAKANFPEHPGPICLDSDDRKTSTAQETEKGTVS